jgi:acyl-CoA reductase-like NAD-dependent aldehyde dehydrogenase
MLQVEDVDRAAEAAHAAFLGWRDAPFAERVQVFYRYRDLLERNADAVARILSRESGKTLEEPADLYDARFRWSR